MRINYSLSRRGWTEHRLQNEGDQDSAAQTINERLAHSVLDGIPSLQISVLKRLELKVVKTIKAVQVF